MYIHILRYSRTVTSKENITIVNAFENNDGGYNDEISVIMNIGNFNW